MKSCISYFRTQPPLEKFRVTEEGFNNRYRSRGDKAPHCDVIYPVMYPNKDNIDYTIDQNKNTYRENVNLDRYSARKIVNGDFDIKVLAETYPDGLL